MGELSYTVGGDSNLVNFRSAARVPITSLKAHFLPKQDLHGYSKPWVGGSGKNLFNKNNSASIVTGLNIDTVNNTKQFTNATKASFVYIPCQSDTTYTVSKIATARSAIGYVTIEPPFSAGNVIYGYVNFNSTTSATTTTGADATYLIVYINNELYDDTPLQNILDSLQIEKGSSATSYEPYENICPIEGWNNAEVVKTGKNLFNKNTVVSGYISAVVTSIRALGDIIASSNWRTSDYIKVNPLTTYTLSIPKSENASVAGLVMFSDKKVGAEIQGISIEYMKLYQSPYTYTFTTPNNCKYIRFAVRIDLINNVQLEQGNQLTNYEPYQERKIPITFPVLGKNKLQIQSTTEILNTSTGWNNTNIRDVNVNAVYVNISSNNYWTGKSSSTYVDNISDGTISYHTSSSSYGIGRFVPVIPNKTYILSYTSESCLIRVGYYDKDGKYLNINYSAVTSFTTTENTHYVLILFTGVDETQRSYTISNLQLELGSTATSYEAYNSDNTVYGGYVDVSKGEIVAEWKIDTTNGRGWELSSDRTVYSYTVQWGHTPGKGYSSTERPNAYHDSINTHCQNLTISANDNGRYIGINQNGALVLGYSFWKKMGYDITTMTAEDITNFFINQRERGTPFYVCYPLLAPIHYPLSKTELQTFLDQNNIWTNTNSTTEVSYAIYDSEMIRARKKEHINESMHHQGNLIFWLDGNDAPVNGSWVDKVGGLDFTLASGITHDSTNGLYNFCLNGIGKHSTFNDIDLKHHWRIEYDYYMKYDTSQSGTFFDIGSTTNAQKALGIGLSPTGYVFINWKLQGNTSSPFTASEDRTHPNWPPTTQNDYVHIIGYYEMYSYNDNYDKLSININGAVKKYNTLFPKANYSPLWNNDGYPIISVGGGVYQGTGAGYRCDCKIHSIKIYVLD